MDISKTSIAYAQQSAGNKGLDIAYIQASYLDAELEAEQYDLVVLIYTDLGVLTPTERERLLHKIYKALKKGGLFIFDVMRDSNLEDKTTPRTWEAPASGFWKDAPYLALSESFLYKDEKVILFQHVVVGSDENVETYRFWTHFFSEEDVVRMLKPHGFAHIRTRNDVLPAGDQWNGDNVLFCMAQK
jgi:SAM-dependent methyltransferase